MTVKFSQERKVRSLAKKTLGSTRVGRAMRLPVIMNVRTGTFHVGVLAAFRLCMGELKLVSDLPGAVWRSGWLDMVTVVIEPHRRYEKSCCVRVELERVFVDIRQLLDNSNGARWARSSGGWRVKRKSRRGSCEKVGPHSSNANLEHKLQARHVIRQSRRCQPHGKCSCDDA